MVAELPVVLLMGPTASGKTALAVTWSELFPVRLVSVDSALVYRGMDIGTAKPTADILSRTPHDLIDIRDPADAYSASQFVNDALDCIQCAHRSNRIPVLVGGTMLYFKALIEGLSPLPPANPSVRSDIWKLASEKGWSHVHSLLAAVDPVTADRLRPTDSQRIQRALEVYKITGIPMSELHRETVRSPLSEYRVVSLALVPEDRVSLHHKIGLRFRQMLDNGFVEEVERLKASPGLSLDCPSMRSVGYRQIWEYLDGTIGYSDMVDKALASTRQLAKRQLTWMRNWPYSLTKLATEDPRLIEKSQIFIKGLL